MIQILVTSSGNILGDAIRHLSNSQPAIEAAVIVAKRGIQRNFDAEASGRGPWKALSPRTVQDRRSVGLGARPILYRGGRYRAGQRRPDRVLRVTFEQDSPLSISPTEARLGSRDPRARWLGRTRPIVVLQQDDARKVFAVMVDKLTRG